MDWNKAIQKAYYELKQRGYVLRCCLPSSKHRTVSSEHKNKTKSLEGFDPFPGDGWVLWFNPDGSIARVRPTRVNAPKRGKSVPAKRVAPVFSSVIIPAYNNVNRLLVVLAALQAQVGCSPFEIIVVSDGCSKSVAAAKGYLSKWNLRVFDSKNVYKFGAMVARNIGAVAARGRQLIFLDPDIVFDNSIVAGFQKEYRSCTLLIARCDEVDKRNQNKILKEERRKGFSEKLTYSGRDMRGWSFWHSVSVDKESFLSVGGYDHTFIGQGGSDSDFGARHSLKYHCVRFLGNIKTKHLGLSSGSPGNRGKLDRRYQKFLLDSGYYNSDSCIVANGGRPDLMFPSVDEWAKSGGTVFVSPYASRDANKKLAIVIPYRDREEHLRKLLPALKKHLARYHPELRYEVCIIEQEADGKMFNRGATKNIGFDLIKDDFDYVCFHDVDTMPLGPHCVYSYPDRPTRIATYLSDMGNKLLVPFKHNPDRMYKQWGDFFGAVVIMSVEAFSAANGYSNAYWGWGREDIDLRRRLEFAGYKIDRIQGRYRRVLHNRSKKGGGYTDAAKRGTVNLYAKVWHSPGGKDLIKNDGLSSLKYTVLGVSKMSENVVKYTVKVQSSLPNKTISRVVLIPYFGALPPWFGFFLRSCAENPGTDWLIFTDAAPISNAPKNVRFVRMTIDEFNKTASSVLGVATSVSKRFLYKLCDFKPAYGDIFKNYTGGYDYFGFGDVDVIYGNLDGVLETALAASTCVSFHKDHLSGHLAFFKNTEKFRKLYEGVPRIKQYLSLPGHICKKWPKRSVCETHFGVVVRKEPGALFFESFSTPGSAVKPWRSGKYVFPKEWVWNYGRLTNDLDGEIGFPYLHFLHWKADMVTFPTKTGSRFALTSEGFRAL